MHAPAFGAMPMSVSHDGCQPTVMPVHYGSSPSIATDHLRWPYHCLMQAFSVHLTLLPGDSSRV